MITEEGKSGLSSAAGEEHFTVSQLARQWTLSRSTVREWFIDEPGVLRHGKSGRSAKRDYVSLRVPASVAERVYRRHTRSSLAKV
jgi:hypothetical protein